MRTYGQQVRHTTDPDNTGGKSDGFELNVFALGQQRTNADNRHTSMWASSSTQFMGVGGLYAAIMSLTIIRTEVALNAVQVDLLSALGPCSKPRKLLSA